MNNLFLYLSCHFPAAFCTFFTGNHAIFHIPDAFTIGSASFAYFCAEVTDIKAKRGIAHLQASTGFTNFCAVQD
jgi:hypothetical protein